MTSEVPTTQTATTAAAAPGFRQRFAGLGMKGAIRQAGLTLTKREARAIAKQSGKSVAEVMSGAVDQGVTLGSGLVNQFNRGKLGPGFQNAMYALGGVYAPGQSKKFTQAIQNLQPLQGLSMPAGSVYAGAAGITKDGQTTFNPVVLPKAVLKGAMSSVSGDLGYSAPTQSGTAAESAALETAPVATPSPRAKAAKAKARKVIAKRKGRSTGKQGQA